MKRVLHGQHYRNLLFRLTMLEVSTWQMSATVSSPAFVFGHVGLIRGSKNRYANYTAAWRGLSQVHSSFADAFLKKKIFIEDTRTMRRSAREPGRLQFHEIRYSFSQTPNTRFRSVSAIKRRAAGYSACKRRRVFLGTWKLETNCRSTRRNSVTETLKSYSCFHSDRVRIHKFSISSRSSAVIPYLTVCLVIRLAL